MLEEDTKNEGTNNTGEPKPEPGRFEEYEISGDRVMAKIKELVREGRVRRISLQNKEGKTLLEIPLTVGVAGAAVGALLAPFWIAIAAIAALAAQLRIVVERVEE
jgi:hypothetical protein